MFVGYTLINDETGQTVRIRRARCRTTTAYEDGESWTEGSRADAVALPGVPAGRYFLRIEPEGERDGNADPVPVTRRPRRGDIVVVPRRAGARSPCRRF